MTNSYWTAVVVNYESGEHLERCVRSLLADTSAAGPPTVVVVDNGSTDGSVAGVERGLPNVTILRPGENVGYSGAANLGIARTDAQVIAVCNADLTVREGTAAAMLARLVVDDDGGPVAVGHAGDLTRAPRRPTTCGGPSPPT